MSGGGGGDPTKIYRAFRNIDSHIATEGNHKRLKSSWFSSRGQVSIELGALTSPLGTYERHQPCGVAAISLEKLKEHGLVPEMDPLDTLEDLRKNPAHRIVRVKNDRIIKDITLSAEIIIALPDIVVVGANGTIGDQVLQPAEPMPLVQGSLFPVTVGAPPGDVEPDDPG